MECFQENSVRENGMSKRRRTWNQSIYEKYIREGRGQGTGTEYKPWIKIQNFASSGMVARVKGRKTNRVHHLMSRNELAYFYLLEWSDKVLDIREQYPLSDLEAALRIADEAGIKYPADKASGFPYVLTCDFMITMADGEKARTIKMTPELSEKRVLEKLEIERRYWVGQGIEWKIVTEREIAYTKARNIEWFYSACDADINGYENEINLMLEMFESGGYSVIETARAVEGEFSLKSGIGLLLFKYLALNKRVEFDMSKPIDVKMRGITVTK